MSRRVVSRWSFALPVADQQATSVIPLGAGLLVVQGWGRPAAAIGVEQYSLSGEHLGTIRGVRTDVAAAIDLGAAGCLLLAAKRVVAVDLARSKVMSSVAHAPAFDARVAVCGLTAASWGSTRVMWKRVSGAGAEVRARFTSREPLVDVVAESEDHWWVTSSRALTLVDVSTPQASTVRRCELPFPISAALVSPVRGIAFVMDLSVGTTGCVAVMIELPTGRAIAQAPVPNGVPVWDYADRVALVDEGQLSRLGPSLEVFESVEVPDLRGDRFPLRVVPVGPADVVVPIRMAAGAPGLIRLAWGAL